MIKIKMYLPLSEHIRYERILQGSFDDVEKLLQPYLINDIGAVLTDLSKNKCKVSRVC